MKSFSRAHGLGSALCAAALYVLAILPCLAVPTLTQQINPPEANIGDDVQVTFVIQNGSGTNFNLQPVDGLQNGQVSTATSFAFQNGSISSSAAKTFHLIPTRAGDFTIPAFDIRLQDGTVLHAQAMKLHVLASGAPSTPQAPTAQPTPNPSIPVFNPNGPVVMPPANNAPPQPVPGNPAPSAAATAGGNAVPTESDGRPAKVFLVITPQTTDAYVGQSIPMKIEWFIRLDADAQQDSLPTIKGSDFLMNNLSVRFHEDTLAIMDEGFRRESWSTAISAPKPGDFPLQMERDSYWIKSINPARLNPFVNFFPGRPNLAHEAIASNQLTIHVHDLPDEGRPANFTGAIGQFTATATAQPDTVAVGEPVTLHFTVTGQGNFDYVRCPTLAADPAWKTYVPSSKFTPQNESHTQGIKDFEMAVIPQKNGTLPLPPSSFNYFDPTTKQYLTVPITLPNITVTGTMTAPAPATGVVADSTAGVASTEAGFLPNRITSGWTKTSLVPIYRQTWFWVIQGGLFTALVVGLVFLILRARTKPDDGRDEKLRRQHSMALETDAMGTAVQKGDALAFFVAARHAVQLHLGTQWRVNPESLTLTEIRQRNPQLAETLEPLFVQADEIIYSGGTGRGLDLAQWERHVRDLLQPQAQPA